MPCPLSHHLPPGPFDQLLIQRSVLGPSSLIPSQVGPLPNLAGCFDGIWASYERHQDQGPKESSKETVRFHRRPGLLGSPLFMGQHQYAYSLCTEDCHNHVLPPELLREEHLSHRWTWQNHFNILGSLGFSHVYPASRSRLLY